MNNTEQSNYSDYCDTCTGCIGCNSCVGCGNEYQGYSHHNFLIFSIKSSLFLLLVSMVILFFYTDHSSLVLLCEKYEILNIWFAFAKFIRESFNPAIGTIAGLAISAIIIFIKGNDKHFYLQLSTFYKAVNKSLPYGLLILLILLVFSIALEIYADSKMRSTAATLAAASVVILISSVIYYIIRYNNESHYFQEEECLVISSLFFSVPKMNAYLSLVLPDSPEKYNTIEKDVDLLKLLLMRQGFPVDHERGYEQIHIMPYMERIIIPYITRMMKTYSKTRGQLIIKFQETLTVDFSNNSYFNKIFRYLLMVISRQYLIQFDDDKNTDEANQIEMWLVHSECSFFELYEKFDYYKLQDYSASQVYYDIYEKYIEQLHLSNIISANEYIIKEKKYMKKRKNLNLVGSIANLKMTSRYLYSIPDVIFINKMNKI